MREEDLSFANNGCVSRMLHPGCFSLWMAKVSALLDQGDAPEGYASV